MILNIEYFKQTIENCKKEQEKLRLDFERQEGVIRFCEYTIKRMADDEKETQKTQVLS